MTLLAFARTAVSNRPACCWLALLAMISPVVLDPTARPAAATPAEANDIIGEQRLFISDGERTLLDVAREYDLGVLEVMAANPGVDPWLPGDGTVVLLPTAHLLPDAPRRGIVINLAELRLYYFPGSDEPPMTSAIGIGRTGFTTPLGETKVVRKQQDPTWYPTPSTLADNQPLPAAVPPGPDNPLGKYALYLGWDTYLIHGTNKPYGVGRRVSRGCIRLYPERIEELYRKVPIGTPVSVVHQPVKLGWHDGDLYIEVHPDLAQLDKLEQTGRVPLRPAGDYSAQIVAKAGTASGRLDWKIIRTALAQRLGIPIRITQKVVPSGTEAPALLDERFRNGR